MKVDITNTAQAQAAELARHFAAPLGSDAALRAEVEALRAESSGLQVLVDAANAQNLELIAKVEALETELEATRDKLQAAGANVDELNAEIAALKTATTNAKGKGK